MGIHLTATKAIVHMRDGDETDRAIFNSIYGVAFFGVPNQGIRVEHWLPMVKGQPNENLIRDLGPHSTYLRTVHDEFRAAFSFPDYAILFAYETELTRVAKVSVIDRPTNATTHFSFNRKRSLEDGLCLGTSKCSSLLTRPPTILRRTNVNAVATYRSSKTIQIWSNFQAHTMKTTN
jgi:hypothetical protein